jgi:uncharacterized membrane protein YeaQ/YmgE (transglycosylase-associated protein family)
MTIEEFLILLALAGVCGVVAQSIVGFTSGGCLVSVVLGFIGALVGPILADALRLPTLFTIQLGEQTFPLAWAFIGALLVALVIGILTPKRRA